MANHESIQKSIARAANRSKGEVIITCAGSTPGEIPSVESGYDALNQACRKAGESRDVESSFLDNEEHCCLMAWDRLRQLDGPCQRVFLESPWRLTGCIGYWMPQGSNKFVEV